MSKGDASSYGWAYPEACKPTFETKRLRVWAFGGRPSDDHYKRVMYVACIKEGPDWPGVAVSASICPSCDNEVDWVQTSDAVRGHGYALELLKGIERVHDVRLRLTPVSGSGEILAAKLDVYRAAETGGAA